MNDINKVVETVEKWWSVDQKANIQPAENKSGRANGIFSTTR